jgi:hypothetical protein
LFYGSQKVWLRFQASAAREASERLGCRASRSVALKIAGGDFDRAFDNAAVPVDIFFKHGEAFSKQRDPLRVSVRLRCSGSADRFGRDDSDFLAQVVGHLVDRIGLEGMQLFEKAEQ